jgi:MFS family permease
MGVIVDIAPLRKFPQFRRLWIGYVISLLGSQITIVTVAYQIYRLTHSSVDVGIVSLVQLGPALVGSLLGGPLADAMDRRRLLKITQLGMAVSSVALAFNAQSNHPQIWLIYVSAAVTAGFNGCDSPTRMALMINLVDKESLAAASSIRQLLQQLSYIIGPAVAGAILALWGLTTAYWIDVATFGAALLALYTVAPVPLVDGGRKFGLSSIIEGFQFLKGKRAIQGCFIADLNATILGMPVALFPAIALTKFHGGTHVLGLLYAAPNVGSFSMALFSGWSSKVIHQGRAVLIAIALWGVAITAFGLAPSLGLALVFVACAGAADVISAVFRNLIIQREVPDQLRGRLSSIQISVINAGPRLGNTEAGFVAGLGGVNVSVISGGLGCVLGVLLMARFLPDFLKYRGDLPTGDERALTH